MDPARVLDRPTLVLNRNWTPIRTTTVRDAIGLVAKGSAFILEPGTWERHDLATWADASRQKAQFSQAVVRSPSVALVAPEVIVLNEYAGQGAASVIFTRRNLFKRDRYTCQYCGRQPGEGELTIDHVVPKSRKGPSSFENCVLACVECNKRKANRTPDEAGMRLRKHPRRPSWRSIAQAAPRRHRFESWEHFLGEAYWNVELEP